MCIYDVLLNTSFSSMFNSLYNTIMSLSSKSNIWAPSVDCSFYCEIYTFLSVVSQ